MNKNSGQTIQAMPLLEGKVNLGVGTYKANDLIHAIEDSEIIVTWDTGTTAPISMSAGQDYSFGGIVEVVSGSIHIS